MFLEPLRDMVLIKREAAETETASGLIIAPNSKEEPPRGTVVKVGPGRLLENGELVEPSVKEGDTVIFSEHSGSPIKLNSNDKDLIVMTEQEIIGIIRED